MAVIVLELVQFFIKSERKGDGTRKVLDGLSLAHRLFSFVGVHKRYIRSLREIAGTAITLHLFCCWWHWLKLIVQFCISQAVTIGQPWLLCCLTLSRSVDKSISVGRESHYRLLPDAPSLVVSNQRVPSLNAGYTSRYWNWEKGVSRSPEIHDYSLLYCTYIASNVSQFM